MSEWSVAFEGIRDKMEYVDMCSPEYKDAIERLIPLADIEAKFALLSLMSISSIVVKLSTEEESIH